MDYAVARQRMVAEQLVRRGITHQGVLDAMTKVHRHLFVEEAFWGRAYGDYSLPIGEKQTISQPFMVALMTEALELQKDQRILEIGTGSGYQTAILAELGVKVYSVERNQILALRARRCLESLGYYHAWIRVGDGSIGWKEKAPFDAIIVSAGAPGIPQCFTEQLTDGGRLILPVGEPWNQVLKKGTKRGTTIRWTDLGNCTFVKLIGKHGWDE
jgi:protein-L-isoaspartate(D-aspartate) O-methyltransferase